MGGSIAVRGGIGLRTMNSVAAHIYNCSGWGTTSIDVRGCVLRTPIHSDSATARHGSVAVPCPNDRLQPTTSWVALSQSQRLPHVWAKQTIFVVVSSLWECQVGEITICRFQRNVNVSACCEASSPLPLAREFTNYLVAGSDCDECDGPWVICKEAKIHCHKDAQSNWA